MSNSTKTFLVAGYSTHNGVRKVRVAKNMQRAKVLERGGHKDIVLHELPFAMTKEQALDFLANGNTVAQATVKRTFEEALASVALRNDKGHFIKREVREAMARELML